MSILDGFAEFFSAAKSTQFPTNPY